MVEILVDHLFMDVVKDIYNKEIDIGKIDDEILEIMRFQIIKVRRHKNNIKKKFKVLVLLSYFELIISKNHK